MAEYRSARFEVGCSWGLRLFLCLKLVTRRKHIFPYVLTEPKILPSFFYYLQNIRLTIFLILAVCGTRIMLELRSGPCSPYSFCSSVVEHRSAEFEGLRCDFKWGSRIFSLSYARDKRKNLFLYFFSELMNLPSFLFNFLPYVYFLNYSAQKVYG